MKSDFGNILSGLSKSLGFPLYIYSRVNHEMVRHTTVDSTTTPVPAELQQLLHDESVAIHTIKKKGVVRVIYFLRMADDDHVILLTDESDGRHMASLVRGFVAFSGELDEKLAHIRKQRDAAGRMSAALNERVKELTVEVEALRAGAASAEGTPVDGASAEELKKLRQQNEELAASLRNASAELALAKAKAAEATHAEAADIGREHLDATLEELQGRIRTLESERAALIKEKELIHAELERLRKIEEQADGTEKERYKALQSRVKSLEKDLVAKEKELAKKQTQIDDAARAFTQMEKDLEQAHAKITEMTERANDLVERVQEKDDAIDSINKEMGALAETASARSARIEELDRLNAELTEAHEALKKTARDNENLVGILQNSRAKMLKLIDGLVMPLFAVSPDYKLTNVNRAVGEFTENRDIPSMIGTLCYKTIYGLDEPCPWCRMERAMVGQENSTENIAIDEDTTHPRHYQHTMFPIYDKDGVLTECGESIVDVSEQYELIGSLEKYRDQVKKFKRARVEDLSEIGDLKKAYGELSENYDMMVDRNTKLTKALEKLLTQDSMAEVIQAKTELRETRAKLVRAMEAIRNYQSHVLNADRKYTDLNRRATFQMERLINIMKTKQTVTAAVVEKTVDFLSAEVQRIKHDIGLRQKELDEKVEQANREKMKPRRHTVTEDPELVAQTDSLAAEARKEGDAVIDFPDDAMPPDPVDDDDAPKAGEAAETETDEETEAAHAEK